MVILNVALMVLIGTTMVGFLTWSIFTQYRQYGCGELRIPRRLHTSVKLARPDAPEGVRPPVVASQS